MKPIALLLCIIFSILHLDLAAQKEDTKMRDLFLDAEFFFMNEEYKDALSNYQKMYIRGYEDNGNINYRIGQCYLNIPGEKLKAISYLEKAVQFANARYQEGLYKEKFAPFDAYYFLGNAYRISNEYDKAKTAYEQFKTFYQTRDKERLAIANNEIEACNFAAAQIKNPSNVKFIRLARPVSTNNGDIFPVVSGDMNTMVYISKQKLYDALYYSRKVKGKWTAPINITSEVQSDGDQYPTFLSYDGNELYLRKEDNFEANLYISRKVNGVWTKSKSIGRTVNSKYWDGNACVSKDGNTLYFSSNRKESHGAMDIFKSTKLPNGDWGVPVNVGPKINTIFNEDNPILTEDGKRLYFTSQGHQNMGGYDVFYSEILPDGTFGDPVNLGYPINTSDDDIYFYPVQNGTSAFTSLLQKGNVGMEDLFAVQFEEGNGNIALNNEVAENDSTSVNNPKDTAFLAKNQEATKQLENKIQVELATEEETPTEQAKKSGDDVVVLHSLFFDFNSSELSMNSSKILEYMVLVMKNDPNFKVEFIGHTDAIGSEKVNQILSEKRAQVAKNYLVSKGIPANKIVVKGVGKKEFIAINTNNDGSDNPEGRKYNRRVDVQVVDKIQDKKVVIEDIPVPQHLKIAK